MAALPAEKRAQLSERWPGVEARQFTHTESANVARELDTEGLVLRSVVSFACKDGGAGSLFVLTLPALKSFLRLMSQVVTVV